MCMGQLEKQTADLKATNPVYLAVLPVHGDADQKHFFPCPAQIMRLGKKIAVSRGLFCLLEQFIPFGDMGDVKLHVPVIVDGKAIAAGNLRHPAQPGHRRLYRIEINRRVDLQIDTAARRGCLGKRAVERRFQDDERPGGTGFPQALDQQGDAFILQLAYELRIIRHVAERSVVLGQGLFDNTRQLRSKPLAGSDDIAHMQGNISFIYSKIIIHILAYLLLGSRQEIKDEKQCQQNNKQNKDKRQKIHTKTHPQGKLSCSKRKESGL